VFEFSKATAALLLPLLIWSAVRFESPGAARATFLVAGIALFATARGHGPAASGNVSESLFLLQTFMAVTAATFLVLGATTAERRRAEEQRRKAEQGIRESESRYRSLAEAIDQLMWINDAHGKATYVNPKWEEKVGASVEGGRGIRWEQLVHPDDLVGLIEVRRRSIPAGEPYQIEFRLRMRDGRYRWMLTRVVPVRDAGGTVLSWFGCATDIQELKATHEELVQTKEEAEAANRAKDRFLATLSHELRTPLTPVLAISSALESSPDLPDVTRRQIEIVRRNAELEARLIDDMLDLTRIAKGKLRLSPEPVPLSDALDDVLEICRPEATAKVIALERPGGGPVGLVDADPARLRQVLWNLVKNAIKFTPAGGRIELKTRAASPGRISIEVSDNGAGIDPSDLARIFEPFEQTGHRQGGLGLGLSISRALVEAHGGALTAASEGLGRGATFRVDPAALPERPAPQSDPESGRPHAGLGARRVIIAEKHDGNLDGVRQVLWRLAFDVIGEGQLY
jgi:PAS domain S-box-containing protein